MALWALSRAPTQLIRLGRWANNCTSIGFDQDAPRLETEEFEPRARLVVLELRNYLREEFGLDESTSS
jgi:hypothetical protein